jgi:hypothetical protein
MIEREIIKLQTVMAELVFAMPESEDWSGFGSRVIVVSSERSCCH